MRLQRWCLVPAVALASMSFLPSFSATAHAQSAAPTASGSAGGAGSTDLRGWLARVHAASSSRNYEGTLISRMRGAMSTSRIAHYCEADQRYERVEALDGQPRKVLRHNNEVRTVWPAQRVVVVQQRETLAMFPALLNSPEGDGFERYELKLQGDERVADHEASVLLLKARDGERFSQRLWVDKASGLMLRNDVIDGRGELLESTAFIEVAIDVKSRPAAVLKSMTKLEGYHVVRPALKRTQLDAEGWSLSPPVAGFREINCVRREAPGVEGGLLQAIYSDGLTHVSVFVEPYVAERHKPMQAAIGATHTLMERRDRWWLTVMGDVPIPTLQRFAAALERRR